MSAVCPIPRPGAGVDDLGIRAQESGRSRDPLRLTRLPAFTARRGADPRLPGPTGLPVVGALGPYMRDPFGYLQRCQRKYGDIFRVPLPIWDLVVVAHPELAAEVFNDRGVRFGAPDPPARVERMMGWPFPAYFGERYAERRTIITPMFGKRYLEGLADETVADFASGLSRWDGYAATGEEIDLQHELAKVTLPAFLHAMFSTCISEEEVESFDHDLRTWLAAPAQALLMKAPVNLLPVPGRPNSLVSTVRMYRRVSRMIDERLANPIEGTDLLQVMLDGRLRDGTPLPRKDLTLDAIGLLAAGYETVVAALSWTLALLPTNPEVERRLYDEVDALGGRVPTAVDLERLTWAKACFDEGQRLQGHPFNFRGSLTHDNQLAGFDIPKGTLIGVGMTCLHRDERWWANPEMFDPNHFADRAQVDARPKTAFVPFGSGPHQCVGMAMAYMNAQFLLALIFQKYRIHQRPGWQPVHNASTSTTIKGGFPVTLSRR